MRHFSIPILILLCISSLMIFPCTAAPIWSDDFNDGNYDGWQVTNGTFTVVNHTLKSIGAGVIIHPNTITTGTWSFDLLGMNEWSFDMELMFMSTYPVPWAGQGGPTGYGIHIFYGGWYPYVMMGGGGTHLADYLSVDMTTWTGWQHFDITRNSDGRICVYHEGTLVMDCSDSSVTTSEYLWIGFGLTSGAPPSANSGSIDNIIVSDTVDIEPPAIPFYMQTWFPIVVGAVIVAVVFVIILVLRRKK